MTLAVDTSVLVAIALNQPERSVFIDRIQSATAKANGGTVSKGGFAPRAQSAAARKGK